MRPSRYRKVGLDPENWDFHFIPTIFAFGIHQPDDAPHEWLWGVGFRWLFWTFEIWSQPIPISDFRAEKENDNGR